VVRMGQGQPRKLVLLGATGSIGRSAQDVIAHAPHGTVEVVAVAGGRDVAALADVARRFKVRFAALADESCGPALAEALSGSGIASGAGASAVVEAALYEADMVVGAIAGAAGVLPTHAALAAGRTVALANKECLVCAGAPFMRTAAKAGAKILPMDSEHNAIFQALGGEADRSAPGARSGSRPRRWRRRSIIPIGRWAPRSQSTRQE